jgi:hypothetical protein
MSQEQFNIICKIIQNGAPALAIELIAAIENILNDNSNLRKQLDNYTCTQKATCKAVANKEGK